MGKLYKEAMTTIRRNKFASISATVIIAISAFIFGIFSILMMNLNAFADVIGNQVCIEVYLKQDTTTAKAEFLIEAIERIQGVESAKYISQDDAIKRLADTDASLEVLSDMEVLNLIPSSIEITVERPEYIEEVSDIVYQYKDVENIRYGGEVVENTMRVIGSVKDFCYLLLAVMAICTISVISAAISMSVFSERKNIDVMRLLGADNMFIAKPFLMEGVILGGLGGAIAFALLFIFYEISLLRLLFGIMAIAALPAYPTVFVCGTVLIIGGMILGGIGSAVSVKYFLDKAEEEKEVPKVQEDVTAPIDTKTKRRDIPLAAKS